MFRAARSRIELQFHPAPCSKRSSQLYKMYQSRCTAKNSWWWTQRLPETCRVVIPIKLEFSASVNLIQKQKQIFRSANSICFSTQVENSRVAFDAVERSGQCKHTERRITFCALEGSKILGMTAGYKLQHSPDDLIQDRCGFEVKLLAGEKSRLTIGSRDYKVLKH